MLTVEDLPNRIVVFCSNPRCSSDVAQREGGAAETEGKAYLALCNAVDHETEMACDPIEQADRNAWAVAEHKNDMERSGCA